MRAEPGLCVEGDRELLTQMLANLAENAIRHAGDGARIEIALSGEPAGPVLAVADDGPGIPEAERANVLKRFYRLESSRTTPGSGLGLSLVAAIVDLHGATIALQDNRPGLRVVVRFAAQSVSGNGVSEAAAAAAPAFRGTPGPVPESGRVSPKIRR